MQKHTHLFCSRAKTVGAKTICVATISEAIAYIMHICENKSPCQILNDAVMPNNALSTRTPCHVAAPALAALPFPDLGAALLLKLEAACAAKGYVFLQEGLHNFLEGIDVGFAVADAAVAESATCILNAHHEEKRLATMISEICILLVKEHTIHQNLLSTAPILRQLQQERGAHTTFISGPSRTADIERVAAVGVHGPIEQHIIILED